MQVQGSDDRPLPTPACSFCCSWETWQKSRVWVVTFMSYCFFHLARKVYSIVNFPIENDQLLDIGEQGIGLLTTIFLISYALGMFFMGHIADRSDKRYFLTIMMIGSGVMCAATGLLKGHKAPLWAFALLYIATGVFQSGGWPTNVAVMGVWFGKGTRGLVMGVWNAHTSIGNILGALIATAVLKQDHYKYGMYTTRCGTPQHGLSSNKMAPITSDCGTMCYPSIKWP